MPTYLLLAQIKILMLFFFFAWRVNQLSLLVVHKNHLFTLPSSTMHYLPTLEKSHLFCINLLERKRKLSPSIGLEVIVPSVDETLFYYVLEIIITTIWVTTVALPFIWDEVDERLMSTRSFIAVTIVVLLAAPN